jgi:hypothetical protein
MRDRGIVHKAPKVVKLDRCDSIDEPNADTLYFRRFSQLQEDLPKAKCFGIKALPALIRL